MRDYGVHPVIKSDRRLQDRGRKRALELLRKEQAIPRAEEKVRGQRQEGKAGEGDKATAEGERARASSELSSRCPPCISMEEPLEIAVPDPPGHCWLPRQKLGNEKVEKTGVI